MKIICCFYASVTYGSEYRAGIDSIRVAVSQGFDLVLMARLDENSSEGAIRETCGDIRVVQIGTILEKQDSLYRYGDALAQCYWHFAAANWLKRNVETIDVLWVQNGAAPWLPLGPYLSLCPRIIYGPVGGGETPSLNVLRRLPFSAVARELLRMSVERMGLILKRVRLRANSKKSSIRLIARTRSARELIHRFLSMESTVVPEVIEPIAENVVIKKSANVPMFIWAGQDIPRKNLDLAISLFVRLRDKYFHGAQLCIYGCKRPRDSDIEGVRFLGWVSEVPWGDYKDNGILLLTSYREGLPSSVLEAAQCGLYCVATEVGALSELELPNLHLLPMGDYPDYPDCTIDGIAREVSGHLASRSTIVPRISFGDRLLDEIAWGLA